MKEEQDNKSGWLTQNIFISSTTIELEVGTAPTPSVRTDTKEPAFSQQKQENQIQSTPPLSRIRPQCPKIEPPSPELGEKGS